ncbi:MAG: hypothetical protein ACI4A3_10625 [Lachnospiraceae bacterium]
MKEKPTTELLNILNQMDKTQMDSYISQYGSTQMNTNIFSEYIAENNITAASIVQNCMGLISKSYIYDILGGIKTQPSRDIILILCIAAKMNRKTVRRVLETYHHRDLYAKDTRDIIIATYINNKDYDLNKINDALYQYKLPLLKS